MNAHALGSRPWTVAIGLLFAVTAGIAAGVAVTYAPSLVWVLAVAATAGAGGLVLLRFRYAVPSIFLGLLGWVLAGYACFGRSFAYLGVPPLFVGELALGVGLIAMLTTGSVARLFRSPVIWLLIVLALWGAARTIPYVGVYHMDALRDAALWGYGAFTIITAACVLRTRSIGAICQRYDRAIRVFVFWFPLALAATRLLEDTLPLMPGTGEPLLNVKASDGGVHLAGAAAFALAGWCVPGDRPQGWRFWLGWAISFGCVSAVNRAGFVGISVSFLLLSILEPSAIGRRVAAWAVAGVLATVVSVALFLNLSDTSQLADASVDRALSPRQVVENVLSIVGMQTQAQSNLEGTKEWRLDWWKTIINYTLNGPYFWTGKGYGVNLADEDGFQVAQNADAPLRSPHNGHMTILARSGVPGVLIWVSLHVSFGWSLLRAYRRARRARAWHWVRIDLWILSYWLAFLVIATFDVFLEGPMAGVWFWCVMGFGVAAIEAQRQELALRPVVAWR